MQATRWLATVLGAAALAAAGPAYAQKVTGACCFYDGYCAMLDAYRCFTIQGTYLGDGVICEPNPCPQPTGVCCHPDGSCRIDTLTDCKLGGSVFLGEEFVCDPNPCPQYIGPCCLPTGVCAVMTHAQCLEGGGTFQGNNLPCSPTLCAPTPSRGETWGRIKTRYRVERGPVGP